MFPERGRARFRGLLVTPVAVVAVGCGGAPEEGADRAADAFAAAVDGGDGGAACELLAPATVAELVQSTGKPCTEAVLEEISDPGRRIETETFGTMAQVRYSNDVMFVTEFEDGWKVMAAGCTSRPGAPYDCRVKGR